MSEWLNGCANDRVNERVRANTGGGSKNDPLRHHNLCCSCCSNKQTLTSTRLRKRLKELDICCWRCARCSLAHHYFIFVVILILMNDLNFKVIYCSDMPPHARQVLMHACLQEQTRVFGDNKIKLDFSHKPETMHFSHLPNPIKPAPIRGVLVSHSAKMVGQLIQSLHVPTYAMPHTLGILLPRHQKELFEKIILIT